MKGGSARFNTVSPKPSDLFPSRKFASTRLLTTTSSRSLANSKPIQRVKVGLSRSRDSPYGKSSPSRSRSALNLFLPLSSTFSSPSRTPATKLSVNPVPAGSALKKYAKELFKRYDERTSELSKVQREKQELHQRLQELTQRVNSLERERTKKDEVIRQLQSEISQSGSFPGELPHAMSDLREKLTRFLRSSRPA